MMSRIKILLNDNVDFKSFIIITPCVFLHFRFLVDTSLRQLKLIPGKIICEREKICIFALLNIAL